MPEWLQALSALRKQAGASAILITVADTQGSTPRAAGAHMVVTHDAQFDTIGGGHLEWRAIDMARAMLAASAAPDPLPPQLHRFPLGPALGQCCGGAVQLLFEKIDAGSDAMVAALGLAWDQGRSVWRVLPLDAVGAAVLHDSLPAGNSAGAETTHLGANAAGQTCLYDLCRGERPQVLLFGAGHVGRALAAVLGSLPCRLLWVDQREDLFPTVLPRNTTIEITDAPEAVVRQAEAGGYFIVMTHSHALDQLLSEHILRRNDAAWFGLIGSAAKRLQFSRRLSQRGLSDEQLARMSCPIGIPGIGGKEPASIAIAVAAQLLQLWDVRNAVSTSGEKCHTQGAGH
jgi:xanthine dehydrogenase accessory factor